MFEYNKLKKKYERLYNETLEKNKEILIESFVEYYGEKHRAEIVSRFNEIVFIYFIDWKLILEVSKKNSFEEENSSMFKDLKDFLIYKKNTKDIFKNCFIGSSNSYIVNKFFNIRHLKQEIENLFGRKNYTSFFVENKMYKIICLPILINSRIFLIREINHAILESPTLYNKKEHEFISKVGLKVGPEDSIIEELINQKIAWEVYGIFLRCGGNLDYICPNGFEFYDRNMYLINKFYKEFKEIIKESLITLNKNNLVKRVGKENYEELVNMVNKYCSKEISLIKENKKEIKINRKRIIKDMKEKVINSQELTKDDLKEYYKQLEQSGKKVRILNELPEENDNSLHF